MDDFFVVVDVDFAWDGEDGTRTNDDDDKDDQPNIVVKIDLLDISWILFLPRIGEEEEEETWFGCCRATANGVISFR